MKIIFNKKLLLQNIKKVIKGIPTRTTFDTYNNIFIKVDDKITFFTKNNDFSIEIYDYQSKIIERGDNIISINGKSFYNIIKNLVGDLIEIYTNEDNTNLIIRDGINSLINIQISTNFVEPYNIDTQTLSNLQIPNNKLQEMIKSTIFSVSKDKNLEELNGCLFEIKENVFNIVSLDGYRISHRAIHLNKIDFNNSKCIVPTNTLKLLKNIITKKYESVSIVFNDENICFETHDYKIVSNIIQGQFMEYEKFYPKKIQTKLILEKRNLINSLKKIISFEDNKHLYVKLNINDNSMNITTNTSNRKYLLFKEEIPLLDKTGNDLIIAFNPKFLLDVLNSIDNTEIFMFFGENKLEPCFIGGTTQTNIAYKYLILPIHIH